MKTSQAGKDFIKSWEKLRLEPYKDAVGIWTAGYGFTGPEVKQGVTWTLKQAEDALQGRIDAIDGILNKVIIPRVTQGQWDAIVSLAYNVGQAALRGSTLIRLVNQRQFNKAADEFLKWNHAGGKVLPGLTKRRQAERDLFIG
jgi:lysozyme